MLLALVAASAEANSKYDGAVWARSYLVQQGVSLAPADLEELLFLDGASSQYRQSAALVLAMDAARYGGPDCIAILSRCFNTAPSDVRSACLAGLGFFDDPAAIATVSLGMRDPNQSVRGQAVSSLREIGSAIAIALIVDTVGDTTQPEVVRYRALRSLRDHELEPARSFLIDALSASSIALRTAAASDLAKLGDSRGVDILIDALTAEDASEVQRETAVDGLRAISGKDFGYKKRYSAPVSREEKSRAREKWLEWRQNFNQGGPPR